MNAPTVLQAPPASPVAPDPAILDFVVLDVETACARVSNICQIDIVGFFEGREVFAYETLVNPRDHFSSFNVRIHGIQKHNLVGKPRFGDIHAIVGVRLEVRITVAHSFFDNWALAAACRVHDRAPIETRWLDNVRVAKRAWQHLPSHRVNTLSKFHHARRFYLNILARYVEREPGRETDFGIALVSQMAVGVLPDLLAKRPRRPDELAQISLRDPSIRLFRSEIANRKSGRRKWQRTAICDPYLLSRVRSRAQFLQPVPDLRSSAPLFFLELIGFYLSGILALTLARIAAINGEYERKRPAGYRGVWF